MDYGRLESFAISLLAGLLVWLLQEIVNRKRQQIDEVETKIRRRAFWKRPRRPNQNSKGFPPYLGKI